MQSSPPSSPLHANSKLQIACSWPHTSQASQQQESLSLHVRNTRTSASGSGTHQAATTMALLEPATVPRAFLVACLVLLVLGGRGPSSSSSSVLIGVKAQAQGGGQCLPQLNGLLACRAYLVPGAPDPSADCCSALSAVSHECACSTMGIINSLPGRCNLGLVNCSA